MLIFAVVPLCVWMIYFLVPGFSPGVMTALIWIIMGLFLIARAGIGAFIKKRRMPKIDGWKCKNCRTMNEKVFLVCKECNTPRPDG